MECIKCKTEMITAKLCGDAYGTSVHVSGKKKGFLATEAKSSVTCYVCPKCGYIELNADNPKQLVLD